MFDMQKEVMWKSEFKVHSVRKVKGKDNEMDVKVYHDAKTAKKDIYWVMKVNIFLFRNLRKFN